jgi:hypothetical protein
MMHKNAVYTVTPPDLTLNTLGPSILLLGIALEEIKPYSDVYDNLFPEVEIAVYVGETGFDPVNIAWYRAVAGMANSIFVNLDNATIEEIFIGLQCENDEKCIVFWISTERNCVSLLQLLNSYQYQVFTSLDEIDKFIKHEYNKSS